MPFPTQTLDQQVRRTLAGWRTSFPGVPLGIKNFLGRCARAVGLNLWGFHKAVEDLSLDTVPSPQSSSDYLNEFAYLIGLPNGAGSYGAKVPQPATGGAATLTGVMGTIYANGITATSQDGSTQIELSGSVTIPGSPPGFGSVPAKFNAITTGAVGNLGVGTEFSWDDAPDGADPTFKLTSPLGGGSDTEDNPTIYGRITGAMQTPPRGGAAEDYREWSDAVAGVYTEYVYPKRGGTGTTHVVPVSGGSGQARVPSADVLDRLAAQLAIKQPVWVEFSKAVLPWAPDGRGHVVDLRVTPASTDYGFDWNDSGTAMVVASYVVGPPSQIVLTAVAPPALLAAIDTYNASASAQPPRIQVIVDGTPINPGVGVVAYSMDHLTLTLDELPEGWTPPSGGENVWAYGDVVSTIATGVLALCDSLGPSRASGFADPLNVWQDKLTLSGIIGVAQNAVGPDGNPLIQEVPPGDLTIDGLQQDVQGIDGSMGPELLYLSAVIVRKAA